MSCFLRFFTNCPSVSILLQVNRQVFPVWTYSSLLLLIPVLLVTDVLRYKPVIVLQGLSYVAAFLLLLIGPGVRSAQLALFIYSVATAADVAYFSYIYMVVQAVHYQRVTSYVRAAILLGYAVGALLAQLLVSLDAASLYTLALVTLVSVSMALMTSLFLPMPKATASSAAQSEGTTREDSQDSGTAAARHAGRLIRRLLLDYKACYSSVALLFFCIWSAAGQCGFYQVSGYVQLLWVHIQPQNATAYNGGVDAISTLTGDSLNTWYERGRLSLDIFMKQK